MVLEPEEEATVYRWDDVPWKWNGSKVTRWVGQDQHSGAAALMSKKCPELSAETGFFLLHDAHVVAFKQMERSRFELQFNRRAIRTSATLTEARNVE